MLVWSVDILDVWSSAALLVVCAACSLRVAGEADKSGLKISVCLLKILWSRSYQEWMKVSVVVSLAEWRRIVRAVVHAYIVNSVRCYYKVFIIFRKECNIILINQIDYLVYTFNSVLVWFLSHCFSVSICPLLWTINFCFVLVVYHNIIRIIYTK